MPEYIEVDISKMEINDTITVADLEYPEGVKPVGDPHHVIFHVLLPKVEAAAEEGAEGEESVEAETTTEEKSETETAAS